MVMRLIGVFALFAAGCNSDTALSIDGGVRFDYSLVFVEEHDLAPDPMLNECGDTNPTCTSFVIGPPFSLETDPRPDPGAKSVGLRRDVNGWLGLDQTHAGFDKMWIANTSDNKASGTVSKVDAQSIREVARYATVTCSSLKTGSTAACDGTSGCCSHDDWLRHQARKNKQVEPGHQKVQTTSNDPSRTAVDFNGDLFIANRAFGGQSSVTKISSSLPGCIDRNRNGRIDTSSDVNLNGVIDPDCNEDGSYDDLATVQARPCANGMRQEYYGLDDECILWTTNTFPTGATGRPLALAGVDLKNPYNSTAIAWAGSYNLGKFVRIDGNSGLCTDDVQLPNQCNPYGATVDSGGVLWAGPLGNGPLCYLDTRQPSDGRTGKARTPQSGQPSGYGITMDRDQNVWIGSSVARYSPDRSKGFDSVGSGWWTTISGVGGIGIAADSRNANDYFIWSCDGNKVLRIPGSTIAVMKNDQTIANPGWPSITMPCRGVGVDAQQNVWGVSSMMTTRALVDRNGSITPPKVNGMPAGNNKCPAGDSCPNPGAYTYSDFTGFGYRNFTAPRGFYSYVHRSKCPEVNPTYGTRWLRAEFEAEVPANTLFTVKARDGKTAVPDQAWSDWSTGSPTSPVDLTTLPGDTEYLELEFDFQTMDVVQSPKLKSAKVFYECIFEG